LRHSLV